jgi:hypothetical protein
VDWHVLCFYEKYEEELSTMIKSKKGMPDSRIPDSFAYQALWARGRRFFLSRISGRYFSSVAATSKKTSEEIVLGYESSWPESYKKLH